MDTAFELDVSLCVLQAGEAAFGIDTIQVREVLDQVRAQPVPLAPDYIAGIVAYRGEVLASISLRHLLGMPRARQPGYVVVLDAEDEGAHFGLLVDGIGGVVTVQAQQREPNPQGLDERSAALFDGVYRLPGRLLVRLDPARLQPARLAALRCIDRQPQLATPQAARQHAAGEGDGR